MKNIELKIRIIQHPPQKASYGPIDFTLTKKIKPFETVEIALVLIGTEHLKEMLFLSEQGIIRHKLRKKNPIEVIISHDDKHLIHLVQVKTKLMDKLSMKYQFPYMWGSKEYCLIPIESLEMLNAGLEKMNADSSTFDYTDIHWITTTAARQKFGQNKDKGPIIYTPMRD